MLGCVAGGWRRGGAGDGRILPLQVSEAAAAAHKWQCFCVQARQRRQQGRCTSGLGALYIVACATCEVLPAPQKALLLPCPAGSLCCLTARRRPGGVQQHTFCRILMVLLCWACFGLGPCAFVICPTRFE